MLVSRSFVSSLVVLGAVAAGCGSENTTTSDGSPTFGSSSGNSGYTCVPDADAGLVPRAHLLDTAAVDGTCPVGTHPVPNGGPGVGTTGDGAGSSGASGGTSGGTKGGTTGGNGGGSSGSSGTSGSSGGVPSLCKTGGANNEPDILVGYAPANGQSVGATGQIKVWINDEGAPIIAPGEQVDPTTGAITTPGDRTAKAADGYLWEPALYIAPETAENGGTPHFPTAIKGSYNNTTQKGAGQVVAGMDPAPAGSVLASKYTGEDIWDVASLGLKPGTYMAEFVIHDGDRDRGVGCVTIVIQ